MRRRGGSTTRWLEIHSLTSLASGDFVILELCTSFGRSQRVPVGREQSHTPVSGAELLRLCGGRVVDDLEGVDGVDGVLLSASSQSVSIWLISSVLILVKGSDAERRVGGARQKPREATTADGSRGRPFVPSNDRRRGGSTNVGDTNGGERRDDSPLVTSTDRRGGESSVGLVGGDFFPVQLAGSREEMRVGSDGRWCFRPLDMALSISTL